MLEVFIAVCVSYLVGFTVARNIYKDLEPRHKEKDEYYSEYM